jgi:predicted RNase H-like nuclease (RuvC/YqgF family)
MDDLQDEAVEQTVTEESGDNSNSADSGDKLEKRFRDSQSHISLIQNENKELRDRMNQLVGRLEQLDRKESKQDEKLWIDEISDDSLRDDPSTTKQLIKRLRQEMAEILEVRDRALSERMKWYDPDVRSNASKIAKLREDPELAKLPDEALLVIAKRYAADGEEEIVERRSSGAPMGGKRSVMKKDETKEDKLKKYAPYLEQMRSNRNVVYGGKR